MLKDVNYLVLSDIHLFHKKNRTEEIIANLNRYFDDFSPKSQFANLDMLFIAGDLFDTLVEFPNRDAHMALFWLSRLIDFCSRQNIKLRILEGTPSHDHRQSKTAEILVQSMDTAVDFKYIDTLHIEHVKDLGLHILYMPDEITASADLTLRHVKQLMSENQLDQVDIGIFHGCFTYQMGGHLNNQCHDEATYLSLVRYFINIGHFHTFSAYERIIAEGSFDRLKHGEEEPKGGVLCHISKAGEYTYSFIENKHAKIFKTIDIRGQDLDKAFARLDKLLLTIPDNSYIRIKASKDHPIYIAFDDVKKRYPMYFFNKMSDDEEEHTYQLIDSDSIFNHRYESITLTQDNIVPTLLTEINGKYALTDSQLKLLTHTLEHTKCLL